MPNSFSLPLSPRAISGSLVAAFALLIMTSCGPGNESRSNSGAAPTPAVNAASNSSSPDPSSALPDPCKLLTKAEAESILGEPIGEPVPNSLGGNRICDWKTVKLYGGVMPYSVHIAIIGESQQVWDAGKKLYGKEMRPVSGIGDEAYYLLDDLQIYTRQRSMNINVTKDMDKPKTHEKSIHDAELVVAKTVLPRMQ